MLNTISRVVLAIAFLAASAFAQFGSHDVLYVPIAPSGSCLAGSRIQQVTTGAGPTYTCQNIIAGVGTWAQLSGSGGGVSSVGLVGTGNQIVVTGASPITGAGSWTLTLDPAGVFLPSASLTPNGGLDVSAQTLGMRTDCANGQLLKWNFGASTWDCATITVSGGANTALSNLATPAVNASLNPGVDATIDLNSPALRYNNAWLAGLLGWTNGSGTPNAGLSSTGAGIVNCGNGTQGDASCTFQFGKAVGTGSGASLVGLGQGTAPSLAGFSNYAFWTAPTTIPTTYAMMVPSVAVSGTGFFSLSSTTNQTGCTASATILCANFALGQGNGAKVQLSTGTVNTNFLTKFDGAGNTVNSNLQESGSLVNSSVGSTQNVTYAGGQDANTTITGGGVTIRGANIGAVAGGSAVGGYSFIQGGAMAGQGNGGSVEILPGASTNASQGLQGLSLQGSVYAKGTTVTQWNLQCPSGQMGTADCGATPNTWLGIAEVVNTNTVQVLTAQQSFVNASAAVTLGHTVCAGSTVGKVTDSGGASTCTNAQGSTVGIVVATAGSWTLPDGTAVTATTTLPLIQINPASQVSATGATLTAHGVSVVLACEAASASGTAYTCTTAPSFTPADLDSVWFEADVANTASATLAVNGATAATIKKQGGGTNLVANDLLAGQWTQLTFDGTNWQMQGQLGNAPGGSGTVTVVGAGSLTSTAIVTGGGSQTLQTPSATSTLSAGGVMSLAGSLMVPAGAAGAATVTFAGDTAGAGMFRAGTTIYGLSGGSNEFMRFGTAGVRGVSTSGFGMTNSSSSSSGNFDTCMGRSAAGVMGFNTNSLCTDELALIRANNSCRVTAAVNLTTAGGSTTICSWSLPAVAKTWAWQCQGTYGVTSGTTPAFGLGMNASQAPTSETGSGVIASVSAGATIVEANNSATATASGNQSIVTGAVVTTITNGLWSSFGTVQASATAGTFAVTGIVTGTTAVGTVNAGSTCLLY